MPLFSAARAHARALRGKKAARQQRARCACAVRDTRQEMRARGARVLRSLMFAQRAFYPARDVDAVYRYVVDPP